LQQLKKSNPEEQQTNAQTAVDVVTIPDTGTDEFAQEANARMMATTAELTTGPTNAA
jgi:hypothetical protein